MCAGFCKVEKLFTPDNGSSKSHDHEIMSGPLLLFELSVKYTESPKQVSW